MYFSGTRVMAESVLAQMPVAMQNMVNEQPAKLRSAVLNIITAAVDRQSTSDGGVEIKTLEIHKGYRSSVFVVVEVGYVGDETSMLSVFARTRGHFSVGPRGGIKSLSRKTASARRFPLVSGWDKP